MTSSHPPTPPRGGRSEGDSQVKTHISPSNPILVRVGRVGNQDRWQVYEVCADPSGSVERGVQCYDVAEIRGGNTPDNLGNATCRAKALIAAHLASARGQS